VTPVVVRAGEATPWDHDGPAAAVVAGFLARVRVTGDPRAAEELMADPVRCHQVVSERAETILRSPAEYAAHVRDMLTAYGDFTFRVTEFLTQDDKVYVRWEQAGHDRYRQDDRPGTGAPITEVGSAVYRVASGRIVEYWVQLDRWGTQEQLARASENHAGGES
jgi:predicted ester cyclase